jgi:hypothetical protein
MAVVHLLGAHLPVYWPTKERYQISDYELLINSSKDRIIT